MNNSLALGSSSQFIYATFWYSCFPKCRIIHVFPTCLAPKIMRGLWSFLFFQAINSLYISLFIFKDVVFWVQKYIFSMIKTWKEHTFSMIKTWKNHTFSMIRRGNMDVGGRFGAEMIKENAQERPPVGWRLSLCVGEAGYYPIIIYLSHILLVYSESRLSFCSHFTKTLNFVLGFLRSA